MGQHKSEEEKQIGNQFFSSSSFRRQREKYEMVSEIFISISSLISTNSSRFRFLIGLIYWLKNHRFSLFLSPICVFNFKNRSFIRLELLVVYFLRKETRILSLFGVCVFEMGKIRLLKGRRRFSIRSFVIWTN